MPKSKLKYIKVMPIFSFFGGNSILLPSYLNSPFYSSNIWIAHFIIPISGQPILLFQFSSIRLLNALTCRLPEVMCFLVAVIEKRLIIVYILYIVCVLCVLPRHEWCTIFCHFHFLCAPSVSKGDKGDKSKWKHASSFDDSCHGLLLGHPLCCLVHVLWVRIPCYKASIPSGMDVWHLHIWHLHIWQIHKDIH